MKQPINENLFPVKGYLLDTPDLFSFIKDSFYPSINSAFIHESAKLVLKELAYMIDYHTYKSRGVPYALSELFLRAESQWKKSQDNYGKYHTFNDPLRFNLAIGKSRKGECLAIPFYGLVDSYKHTIESFREFKPYNWDYKLKQENREEWELRGSEWSSIANSDGNFCGLLNCSIEDSNPWRKWLENVDEKLMNFQPTPAERLQAFMKNKVLEELVNQKVLSKSFSITHLVTVENLVNSYPISDLGKTPVPLELRMISEGVFADKLIPIISKEAHKNICDEARKQII